MEIEGLEEPHNDGCQKDHGKGPLEEVLGLVPQQMGHVLCPGHPVVGQFHDEGDRLPPEHGVLGDQGRQNAHQDSQKVQSHHHQCAILGEEGGCQEGVNGQLGRAAHEGGKEDGHFPVPL